MITKSLDTRLNNTFPNCIKSSTNFTIEFFLKEKKLETKYIKVVTISNLLEMFKHLGVVIEELSDDFVKLPEILNHYLQSYEFNNLKVNFVDQTQPGFSMTEKDLAFTRKVYLFTSKISNNLSKSQIITYFKEHGFFLEIRDDEYHNKYLEDKAPELFICHDSRDKEFAEKLHFQLSNSLIKTWFDKYTLKIGDSLTLKNPRRNSEL